MTEAPDLARLVADSGWVRALARSLVADAHAAEDLAQETLAAALQHRGPIESLRAFLATAMRRRVFERRREQASRAERESRTARNEALPSTLDMLERASVQRDLVQAVLELEEPYRTVILWRFFEELAPRAIARRAGVPVATVHTRIQRGLARLRQRLAREHGHGAWIVVLSPLTELPRGASPLGALLVKTSTQLVLAVSVIVAGALVALRLLAREEGSIPALVEAPSATREREPLRDEVPDRATPSSEREVVAATLPAAPPAEAPVVPAPVLRILQGLVLDDLGRELGGVVLATEPGGERFESGANGRFSVPLTAPAEAVVSGDARFATVLAGATTTTAEPGAVVVLAARLALAGWVVDDVGAGLAGAELMVVLPRGFGSDFGIALDGALQRRWSAVSAADGAFRLADVPAVAGAELVVRHGGYETWTSALPRVSDEALRIPLVRVRAAEELVRGRVELSDGAPAAGARVAFGLSTMVCGDDGRFELAARAGEHPRFVRAVRKGLGAAQQERIEGDAWPAEIVLRLGASSASIRGHVLGADGTPVAGARVWLAEPTWFGGVEGDIVATESLAARDEKRFWSFVEAQGDGSFALEGLLPRDYRLRALDPRTLLLVESEPIAAGTRGVELRLPADALFPRVSGRVVDSTGRGFAGVAVVLERGVISFDFPSGGTRDQADHRPQLLTDAEGRFEFTDVPREGVYLFASGDAILFASLELRPELDPEHVEIRAEHRIHLQVELDPPFGRADSLRVLDGDGHGLLLRVMRGATSDTNPVVRIEEGRSQVLSLSERARWVVLYSGQVEVARLAFHPLPEDLNLVRW